MYAAYGGDRIDVRRHPCRSNPFGAPKYDEKPIKVRGHPCLARHLWRRFAAGSCREKTHHDSASMPRSTCRATLPGEERYDRKTRDYDALARPTGYASAVITRRFPPSLCAFQGVTSRAKTGHPCPGKRRCAAIRCRLSRTSRAHPRGRDLVAFACVHAGATAPTSPRARSATAPPNRLHMPPPPQATLRLAPCKNTNDLQGEGSWAWRIQRCGAFGVDQFRQTKTNTFAAHRCAAVKG